MAAVSIIHWNSQGASRATLTIQARPPRIAPTKAMAQRRRSTSSSATSPIIAIGRVTTLMAAADREQQAAEDGTQQPPRRAAGQREGDPDSGHRHHDGQPLRLEHDGGADQDQRGRDGQAEGGGDGRPAPAQSRPQEKAGQEGQRQRLPAACTRSNSTSPSLSRLAGMISQDMISRYISGRWVKVAAGDAGEVVWVPIS